MNKLKQLLISSLILGGGIFCNQAWALEQVDGVYQIGTAQDLIDFATGISNGSISNDANAVLTADIDMTGKEWTPIGDDSHRYIGIFDGQYHTIDNLKATGSTNFGIFGVVNGGCVIKNLIAGPNNEIKGISQIGGIIGCSNGSGWVTLENVGHEGYVEGTGANCCAIIGVVVNGGPATRITNCYNTGDIRAERESAIIAGWFGGHSSVEVKGFFNTGLVLWGQEDNGKSLWRNGDKSITTERIYNINTDQGATEIEDGQLASGALAYLLNGDNLAGVWHQTIGTDAHPVPDASHGIVRKMQDGSYVNRILVGGYYEMAWGEDLKWFADFVKAGNTTAKAKFVSDIDMTDYSSFLGIGAGDAARFNGEIDGQEHKIKNWKVSASEKVGLVRVGGGGLTLRNMTIDGTCSIVGKGCTAAFVADMNGSNDPVTLSNLGNEANVTGEQNASGILGCNYNGSIVITMTNCYNTGNITATKEGGALSGWLGANAKVYNCYNTGSITNGVGLFRGNGSYTNENTYSTVNNNGGGDNNAEAKEIFDDAEKFKDGTVFAKLFDYTNDDPAVNGNVWRMEFSGTPHPVLYDAAMVLKEDFPNRPKSGRTGNVSLYRTIKQGGWNTFCVPFNMSSAQITDYFGAGTEVAVLDESKNGSDDVLHFKLVDEIEAGQAYLVYPGVDEVFSSKAIEGVTISATSPQVGITQAGFTFKGVYVPTALDAAVDRIVVSGNKIVKTTGGSLNGFRAYFKPKDANARATRFVIDDDDEVTGIITAEGEVIMDQPVYNLRGQRVQEGNSSSRGLLIKGGKKYVKM